MIEGTEYPMPPVPVLETLRRGVVIPAHPLAVDNARRLDERRQRALTRYYHAAGAGGLAVGVHTTQFEIRLPEHGLYEPVLALAAETAEACDRATGRRTVRIAGAIGRTEQAVREAGIARRLGYDAVLLSLAAWSDAGDDALIAHCREVAHVMPLVGFYLQPSVGGRVLPFSFWRRFAEIPNVIAIKAAPFNRYQTLDVVRGVAEAGRAAEIALYTGNDDHILLDLAMPNCVDTNRGEARVDFVGGLLGHWAVWTQRAVEQLDLCRQERAAGGASPELLKLALQVTDSNGAFFDVANGFAGAIVGVHEVLRRQGLMANNYTLNPSETLSDGQRLEIDRVYRSYPHLNDDRFVREHLDEWLR